MRLSELTAPYRRLALVGLAKNTGKTETLAALLRELDAAGRRVGVTSIGRDGEAHDVIDARIEKPRLQLAAGSLVASTDALLRASALEHELLEETNVRTPLGRVLVARVRSAGAIEVAGPSAAADVSAVTEMMLAHGAEQVLIDGAVDRRAASSPHVSDGLVIATGAVLDHDIEQVVAQTRDAVELVRLAGVASISASSSISDDDARMDDASSPEGDASPASSPEGEDAAVRQRLLALADSGPAGASVLAGDEPEPVALAPRFVLTAQAEQSAKLLDEHPGARWLLVAGALPERFLHSLVQPLRQRQRELVLVVADPTKVFLSERGPGWYARQGVHLRAFERISIAALTVNPVAPQSHRFDSGELRQLLARAIAQLAIFDVLHPDYRDGAIAPGVSRPSAQPTASARPA